MQRVVAIDSFPESVQAYAQYYTVVPIDVIRATTTAITAVASGRRCFPVASIEAAHRMAARLPNALLAGEIGGEMPPNFHFNNSPALLDSMPDRHRPLILLSTSGTRLLHTAGMCKDVFPACLRNASSLTEYLAGRYPRIAIIGAGSRSEFREEDQMCCAWIARGLMDSGYAPLNNPTLEITRKWGQSHPEAMLSGKSAAYLKRTGQLEDLEFILSHINDLNAVFAFRNGEVVEEEASYSSVPAPLSTHPGPARESAKLQ